MISNKCPNCWMNPCKCGITEYKNDNKLSESEFIDLCKKVEIYIKITRIF